VFSLLPVPAFAVQLTDWLLLYNHRHTLGDHAARPGVRQVHQRHRVSSTACVCRPSVLGMAARLRLNCYWDAYSYLTCSSCYK
jgi:hypothetical protein